MKKWMRKMIQSRSPLYFHIIKEIKKFKRMGYEVEKIHLTWKGLDELFTANVILRDGGIAPTITFDKKNDNYFDGIPIIRYSDRIGFTIKRSDG